MVGTALEMTLRLPKAALSQLPCDGGCVGSGDCHTDRSRWVFCGQRDMYLKLNKLKGNNLFVLPFLLSRIILSGKHELLAVVRKFCILIKVLVFSLGCIINAHPLSLEIAFPGKSF